MTDVSECIKRYYVTSVDPGCECCSYVTVAGFDSMEELAADFPNLDGYIVDIECECEEDHV